MSMTTARRATLRIRKMDGWTRASMGEIRPSQKMKHAKRTTPMTSGARVSALGLGDEEERSGRRTVSLEGDTEQSENKDDAPSDNICVGESENKEHDRSNLEERPEPVHSRLPGRLLVDLSVGVGDLLECLRVGHEEGGKHAGWEGEKSEDPVDPLRKEKRR